MRNWLLSKHLFFQKFWLNFHETLKIFLKFFKKKVKNLKLIKTCANIKKVKNIL